MFTSVLTQNGACACTRSQKADGFVLLFSLHFLEVGTFELVLHHVCTCVLTSTAWTYCSTLSSILGTRTSEAVFLKLLLNQTKKTILGDFRFVKLHLVLPPTDKVFLPCVSTTASMS